MSKYKLENRNFFFPLSSSPQPGFLFLILTGKRNSLRKARNKEIQSTILKSIEKREAGSFTNERIAQ